MQEKTLLSRQENLVQRTDRMRHRIFTGRRNKEISNEKNNEVIKLTKPFGKTQQVRPGAGEGRAVRRDGRRAGGASADAQLWKQVGGRRRLQGERIDYN